MLSSSSSPVPSSSFVAGAVQPPTAPELPGSSKNTAVETHKTIGLDNPEVHGASATPLDLYSIKSSDDESEGNDNRIVLLKTDQRILVDMNQNVQALELVYCLLFIVYCLFMFLMKVKNMMRGILLGWIWAIY